MKFEKNLISGGDRGENCDRKKLMNDCIIGEKHRKQVYQHKNWELNSRSSRIKS